MITNPVKAIKAKCIDCCCGSFAEVKLCENSDCALHPFRLGKNPYRTKREMSEEQRQHHAEILARVRSSKNPC